MNNITVFKQGETMGISLPLETCARLGIEAGQTLTLVELADGIKLVKHNPELERQMIEARKVLVEQADVLRELAKR